MARLLLVAFIFMGSLSLGQQPRIVNVNTVSLRPMVAVIEEDPAHQRLLASGTIVEPNYVIVPVYTDPTKQSYRVDGNRVELVYFESYPKRYALGLLHVAGVGSNLRPITFGSVKRLRITDSVQCVWNAGHRPALIESVGDVFNITTKDPEHMVGSLLHPFGMNGGGPVLGMLIAGYGDGVEIMGRFEIIPNPLGIARAISADVIERFIDSARDAVHKFNDALSVNRAVSQ